jgi:hypothetical protein
MSAELERGAALPRADGRPGRTARADVRAAARGRAKKLQAAFIAFRDRLDACRAGASSVYTHLEDNGISVGLVFRLRQLRERVLRIRELLDCLMAPNPAPSVARLVGRLVLAGGERNSIRALIASNSSMLAAKVTERSAETGEHYITRDRASYLQMVKKAAGGGALTAVTVLLKFGIYALGLSAFWAGLGAGLMYAASFVAIQLLHLTLATKQPAMTAPAMAARLRDIKSDAAVDDFVDEVANLVRSQVAAVLGNVLVVVPAMLGWRCWQAWRWGGRCSTRRTPRPRCIRCRCRPDRALCGIHRHPAVFGQHRRRLDRKRLCPASPGLRHALQPPHRRLSRRRTGPPLGRLHAHTHLRLRLQHLAGTHARPAARVRGFLRARAGCAPRDTVGRADRRGRGLHGPGGAARARAVVWAEWVRPSAGLPTVQWSLLLAAAAAAGHLVQRYTGLPKVVGYSIVGTVAGLAGFEGAAWPLQGIACSCWSWACRRGAVRGRRPHRRCAGSATTRWCCCKACSKRC